MSLGETPFDDIPGPGEDHGPLDEKLRAEVGEDLAAIFGAAAPPAVVLPSAASTVSLSAGETLALPPRTTARAPRFGVVAVMAAAVGGVVVGLALPRLLETAGSSKPEAVPEPLAAMAVLSTDEGTPSPPDGEATAADERLHQSMGLRAAQPAVSSASRTQVAVAQLKSPALRASRPLPAAPTAADPDPGEAATNDACRDEQTLADELLCADPELAMADRAMSEAYEAAQAAGVSRRTLRTEQADWLDERDAAARRAPQALKGLYRRRTMELWAMAEPEVDEAFDEGLRPRLGGPR